MAYTSFGTRKALGRRYGVDPALLLEMERLNQQYQLAPGREARGLQASQFEYGKTQDVLNRKEREEANRQAGKSSMYGTIGNAATTGLTLRMLAKDPNKTFWTNSPKTTAPADVSMTSQTPTQIQQSGGIYGTQAAETAYSVTPAAIDAAGPGLSAGSGAGSASGSGVGASATSVGGGGATAGLGAAETGGATAGSVVGGIAGGISTAMPYYALARVGGVALGALTEGKGGSVPHYFSEMGETLDSPLQVEQYAVKEKLGIDNPVVNTVLDLLNPAGYVVNKMEEATVICTELHRQGSLSDKMLRLDAEHGRKQDIEVMIGYRSWARYVVWAMQRSKIVTRIIKPFALAWAKDMAGEHNRLGAFINKIGVPVCRFIGSRVMEVKYAR